MSAGEDRSEGCRRVRGRLECWLDGVLDPLEAALDRGHLEACAGCRSELDAWRALLDSVRSAARAPGSEAVRVIDEVWGRLDPVRHSPVLLQPGRPQPRRRWSILAAASVILLVAWLGTRGGVLNQVRIDVGGGFSETIERLPSWSQLSDGWSRLSRRFS